MAIPKKAERAFLVLRVSLLQNLASPKKSDDKNKRLFPSIQQLFARVYGWPPKFVGGYL